MNSSRISRRQLLQGTSIALGAMAAGTVLGPGGIRQSRADDGKKPRFLIVLAANGGASLIDGPLALRATESSNASTINCYPDASVTSPNGGAIRAVQYTAPRIGPIPYAIATRQEDFVKKHSSDMLVVTATTTSVNHGVAQRRSVTGNEAWAGRTLQELVAAEYGSGMAIPNVHLVTGSEYTARGSDPSLPSYAYGETAADPLLWPLGLHGFRGMPGGDNADLMAKARALRDGKMLQSSRFSKVFENSQALKQWRIARGAQAGFEKADLISKLMLVADSAQYPLGKSGLTESPSAARVRAQFPDYKKDPLEAQAALAYLLLTQGVSATVTLGANSNFVYAGTNGYGSGPLEPGAVRNLPIAFDYSHTSHRAAQAFMWQRMYKIADGLIELLKNTEFAAGESYWDRTMIYVATDFGRTKVRPANSDDFGTGHDLNNGSLIVSPLAKGGRVLGGVDPATGLTYGFDLKSGAPIKGRTTAEKEVFAGILGAMGVTTTGSGLPDVPAMRA